MKEALISEVYVLKVPTSGLPSLEKHVFTTLFCIITLLNHKKILQQSADYHRLTIRFDLAFLEDQMQTRSSLFFKFLKLQKRAVFLKRTWEASKWKAITSKVIVIKYSH